MNLFLVRIIELFTMNKLMLGFMYIDNNNY